jgi:poly(3-hydroxyalkanoate) depolymerase
MSTVTAPAASAGADTITVGAQRLHFHVRPGERRPPLLLMNGIGCSIEVLQPFVDALSPELEVIRFDVPGVGGSPTPRRPYRLVHTGRLVAGMLDRLGYQNADVLGVSWGGALAQQFAFQAPRRCRRLVLVSTAPGALLPPASLAVVREMATPRRLRDERHARAVAPRLYGGKVRENTEPVGVLHRTRLNARGYLYQQLAMLGWTSLPFARLIRQRTLILTGEDDPIIRPANGRLMRAMMPHAELHVFQDGHLGLVTSAAELAPRIEEFLARP